MLSITKKICKSVGAVLSAGATFLISSVAAASGFVYDESLYQKYLETANACAAQETEIHVSDQQRDNLKSFGISIEQARLAIDYVWMRNVNACSREARVAAYYDAGIMARVVGDRSEAHKRINTILSHLALSEVTERKSKHSVYLAIPAEARAILDGIFGDAVFNRTQAKAVLWSSNASNQGILTSYVQFKQQMESCSGEGRVVEISDKQHDILRRLAYSNPTLAGAIQYISLRNSEACIQGATKQMMVAIDAMIVQKRNRNEEWTHLRYEKERLLGRMSGANPYLADYQQVSAEAKLFLEELFGSSPFDEQQVTLAMDKNSRAGGR